MTESSLYPIVSFDLVDNDAADKLLVDWGHWLGGCNRPFGRQSFALAVLGVGAVSVAVSASTVNGRCAEFERQECVELARLASHPGYRWASRVCLRLWREIAPACWAAKYWPVRACVSYSNNARHTGNLYRFDGWQRWGTSKPSKGGGGWTRPRKDGEAKTVWVWEVRQA